MQNNERFVWALEIMGVGENNNLLEVGCGVGMAVELIAPGLKDGRIVAIDRSPSTITKAIKRNHEYVKNGRVSFIENELTTFSHDGLFDKVFCFNVNVFWTKKSITPEAKVIREHLSKNGLLYTFFGPLFAGSFKKITSSARKNLEQEKFKVLDMIHEKKNNCCCLIAQP
jgi:cyclopropane fatty-acyl-phospholipid synthase-like methyltransferase